MENPWFDPPKLAKALEIDPPPPPVDSEQSTLIQQYGPPAFSGKNGLSKLNEPFWAAYFAQQNPNTLYEAAEEQFYSYDESTGLWLQKTQDCIRRIICEEILEAASEWAAWGGLAKFRNERDLRGVIAHLRGLIEQRNAFPSSRQFIHLQNTMLVFEADGTFTAKPFSPDFRSRSRSPILHDPSATCPIFEERLLSHVAPDDRELIQKYAGQCLLGRNLTQRILILDGEAAASKGTIVLVIRGILGASNTYELRTHLLDGRFEIGRMAGKTLLIGPDVKANFLSTPPASRLKSLVGGDIHEAERKKSNDSGSVAGNFNVIITCNSRLTVHLEGDKTAWARRLAIAHYDKAYVGTTIPDFHEKLLAQESSGILNWFLQGLQKLFQDISGETGSLVLSTRQREIVHSLLSESDSLPIFLRENIVRTSSSDNLTGAEIIEAYSQYCFDNEWTVNSRRAIENELANLMLQLFSAVKVNDIKRDGKNQKGYRHVRFRRDDEEDPK